MNRTSSNSAFEGISVGSLNTLRSRVSQLTNWFSFGSRASDCVSNASKSSSITWKWELFQARQRAQVDSFKMSLKKAQQENDRELIRYYQRKISEYDVDLLETLSYRKLDQGKTDTMKAHGKHNRGSIPDYYQYE